MATNKQIRNSTAEFLNLMKNKTLIIALALFSTCSISAAEQQTYRDAQGKIAGTAKQSAKKRLRFLMKHSGSGPNNSW